MLVTSRPESRRPGFAHRRVLPPHFVGGLVTYGRGTTAQILEELPGDDWIKPGWQEDTVRSFHTAPARAAGRKRWEAFRDFCQRAMLEFDGDDLTR